MGQPRRIDSWSSEAPSEQGAEAGAWHGPARLLCAAAILHLSLSATVYVVGRYALFPRAFDGNGVAVAFAPDAAMFRADAAALSEALRGGEVRHWVGADHPFHVKLYSVCFALFGPWSGYTVVGAEPLNALFYLATLVLVFGLGREVFRPRTGLLAAVVVALWPSFLLHTTQFLKDPPFVAGTLALILVVVRWLTRTYSWAGALLTGAASGLIVTVLWLTRADMGEMLVATVLLGAVMLIARQLWGERARVANLVGMALLIAVTLSVPAVMPNALKLGSLRDPVRASGGRESLRRAEEAATAGEAPRTHLWSRAAARVGKVRRRFIEMYPDFGSNIDSDVQINSTADLVRYLPRAAAVGFFAPFPNMWFAPGKSVGSAGRLLAGLESLAMYAVEGLALLGLWWGRRRISAWFLFSVAATGRAVES